MEFVEGKVLRDHFQENKVFCLRGILDSDRSREPPEKGEREFGILLPKGKLGVSQGYLMFVFLERRMLRIVSPGFDSMLNKSPVELARSVKRGL